MKHSPHMDFGERSAGLDEVWAARDLGGRAPAYFHAFGTTLASKCRPEGGERQFGVAAHQNSADASAWSNLLDFRVRHSDRGAAAGDCEKVQCVVAGDEPVREQRVEVGRGRA